MSNVESKRIKTTGQLRQFLADAIQAVSAGNMDLDAARNITKLAGQINESFYSEIKAKRTCKELGEAVCETGDMLIGAKEK